ncbi:MAG: hypothetical protein AAFV53_34785 [Myxococcota bacterium]
MYQIIASSTLQLILSGDTTVNLNGNVLNLACHDDPDFRFAAPDRLEPLFAHPGLKTIQHLEMAEGASRSLGFVLSNLEPDTLQTLTIRTTEAYTSAVNSGTFAALIAHPAARSLRLIRVEYSWIHGVADLVRAPLQNLETLALIGGIDKESLEALAGPAPALRSLNHLTLSPDGLTEALAKRIAASPDLAAVKTLTLPFVQGTGFDWTPNYQADHIIEQLPAALQALQALPGLEEMRLTTPYDDFLEVSEKIGFALFNQLRGGMRIEISDELFKEVTEAVRTWRDGRLEFLWAVPGINDQLPTPAWWWIEGLYRNGLAEAMRFDAPAPSTVDAEAFGALIQTLQRQGFIWLGDENEEESLSLYSLEEQYGVEGLCTVLSERMEEEVRYAHGTPWTPSRISEAEMGQIWTIGALNEHLWPKTTLNQASFSALVETIGIDRIAALYQHIFQTPLVIESVQGAWRIRG